MFKSKVYFIIFSITVINIITVHSQVRIGGGTPASKGAILDVNSSTENSNKGLLLPRVALTSLTTLDDIIPNEDERPDPEEHLGLTIYGLIDDEACFSTTSGVFIWAGNEWVRLGRNTYVSDLQRAIENRSNNNLIYDNDQEGDIIVAQEFGEAGIWMLHNLAVSTFADGTPIAIYNGNNTHQQAFYTYPNTSEWEVNSPTFNSQQGYLYNWHAATRNSEVIVDQRQTTKLGEKPSDYEVENLSEIGYLQGVCPNGWHIPSDREWTELSKELFISSYSHSKVKKNSIDKQNWDVAWEGKLEAGEMGYMSYNSNNMDGVGTVYKDPCKIVRTNASLPDTNGLSTKVKNGGMSVQMAGFVTNTLNVNFGYVAYLWTSSANNNHAYFRSFSTEISGINKSTADKNNLFSVRCKKNEK